VNTKSLKYVGITITVGFIFSLVGYLFLTPPAARNVATQNSGHDQISNQLTTTQQQKWALVEQFNIRQTNASLQIEIPHIISLCTENQFIIFKFTAYEVAIAGDQPSVQLMISCQTALAQTSPIYEVPFSDLTSLQQLKQKSIAAGQLKAELLYTDEPLPRRWNLSEITIEGSQGFNVNQFEIRKVFENNFEFELTSPN
jgi:hypothetical protein